MVTGGAALAVVFAAFMTGGSPHLQIGPGLVAVLIDATVVRTLLVPATTALLGRHAWRAPAAAPRHDRFGVSERHVDPREKVPSGV